MEMPLISVVIPVYNAAPFLAEALASVFAQDYRPIEVIVVDDGSTDQSLAIAKAWSPGLRILQQENAGQAVARNRGIACARGPYVAFIDADDLWPEGKLRRQLDLLQQRAELDFVLGRVEVDYRASAGEGPLIFRGADKNIALFLFGAGLFRRALFDRAGLLSEDLRNSEDVDWFMRAREAGATWLLLDEVGLIYRRHGANLTEHLPLEKTEIFRVLARSAARRRARPAAAGAALDRLTDRREAGNGANEPMNDIVNAPKNEQ
jgi:glycosyltransferase involved in cell wall biosynthesis